MDLGTGSGVIALSLAAKFPQTEVSGVDISDGALALARENAARLGLERVQFAKSDLLNEVDGSFDAIVANLPYVSENDRATLAPEVLNDPNSALFGGERGDEIICRLIEQAPAKLRPNGLLALEIGIDQSPALLDHLRAKNYHDIAAENDYAGVTRFLLARYG